MMVSWLRAKRLMNGYSLSDLEKMTGLDFTYLSRVERYLAHPRKNITAYLKALGITHEEFERAFREKKKVNIRAVIEDG